MSIKLPKTYGQREASWRNVTLGTSQTTIGSHGCAITSVCMLCEYVGIHTTPPQLNQWLKANKGYLKGNLLVWSAIDRYSNGKLIYSGTHKPTQYPQIAEVDLVPKNSTFDQHFVVALDDNSCFDPWENRTRPLSDFNGVKSWRNYKFSGSDIPNNSKGDNMQNELDNMRKQRDDNWLRGETFRQELENTVVELNALRAKYDRVKKERDELAQSQNKLLKELTQLKGKNNALEDQVEILQKRISGEVREMESPRFRLNSKDLHSIGRGAVIALAGALIVFLTDVVAGLDFGEFTPFVVAASAVVVNFLRKWLAQNR